MNSFREMIIKRSGRIHPNLFLDKCIKLAITTKNYNWDNEEYKDGVIEPYKKLTVLRDSLIKERRIITKNEQIDSAYLLDSILKSKKIYDKSIKKIIQDEFSKTEIVHFEM